MTYLQFHILFTIPQITIVAVMLYWRQRETLARGIRGILVIAAIVVLYSTPWDNYLVSKGVWQYGDERVLGTIGYVAFEQYAFFVLQTFLTGLVFLAVSGEMKTTDQIPSLSPVFRRLVSGVLGAVTAAGIALLFTDSTFYLGMILSWAGTIILLQWMIGARFIIEEWKTWAPVVILVALYLSAADLQAIEAGTWEITSRYTTGFQIAGLPVEEVVFFLLTNVMVVWGLVLIEALSLDGVRNAIRLRTSS